MLTSKNSKPRKKTYRLCLRKSLKKVSVFHFPPVKGIEDVSSKLNHVEADSLFSALVHVFQLKPIETEQEAYEAERVLEYIERAFEQDTPIEIEHYRQVLLMLVSIFDEQHYIRTAGDLAPHEFLKALLQESAITKKN